MFRNLFCGINLVFIFATSITNNASSPATEAQQMVTTIDNTHRKFLVQSRGFKTIDIFCNLHDIPNVLAQAFEPHDEYVIYEFWNRKLKRCSKKHLNEMFTANQIQFKVK